MSSGPSTFNSEQLRAIWRNGLRACAAFPSPIEERWQNETLYCHDFSFDADSSRQDPETRKESLRSFCRSLLSLTTDPATHFLLLDQKFSEILLCHYQASDLDPVITLESAVDQATQLLTRLPSVVPQVDFAYHIWGEPSGLARLADYCNSGSPVHHRSPWVELPVVSRDSTVILRLALAVTTSGDCRYNLGLSIRRLVDLISELLDINDELMMAKDRYDIVGTSIVRAFFWTTWQKSLMLFFWFVLKTQIRYGHSREWNEMLALRGCSLLMHPSIRATLYGWANQRHTYMCTWAFEMLRSSRAAMGLDFRRFHQRFAALHQDHSGRCQWQSSDPCDGSHPLSCGRFQDKRLVAAEQSLHDLSCKGTCKMIQWNEASYRSIKGPTAASLDCLGERIQYTPASYSTLAISHVWSHGQGSRPAIGINSCLHHRYVEIAKRNKCTSYWIDSMCIPETHDLRMEAIGFINRIFADSKVTLVCDRDLMAVDINNLTLELLESILATFFVCDWNVRAWTLLEAMKGSHAIYILCKWNQTISLRDALNRVHQDGSVDISILSLAAQHLLPSSTDAFRRSSSRQSTEVAGSILSHRHATRGGDDIVIWSLLTSTNVFKDPEKMWRAKIGHRIATAYLMSNSPRLATTRGFTWAPRTPYIRRPESSSRNDLLGPYNAFDGGDSELGLITSDGLLAEWQVYNVERDDAELYQDSPVTITSVSADGQRVQEILPGHRIKNHCWQMAIELYSEYQAVILIQPKPSGRSGSYHAAKDRGESHGEVFALCASHNKQKWVWKGSQS